jgi:hypothetical protein
LTCEACQKTTAFGDAVRRAAEWTAAQMAEEIEETVKRQSQDPLGEPQDHALKPLPVASRRQVQKTIRR